MSAYRELLQQRVALEQKISEARQQEISDAVAQIRSLIADFELTADDIFPPASPKVRATYNVTGNKVAPKYIDPVTGKTWTGRGKAPKWIDGQNRENFLIAAN
jgi:DNA-binding protein H-NS